MKLFLLAVLVITGTYCTNSKSPEKCEQYKKEAQNRQEYQPDENTNKAKPGEFPHNVIIIYKDQEDNYQSKCGGVLISEKHVLLPAHCVLVPRNKFTISHVRVGSNKAPSTIEALNSNTDFKVKSTKVYPDYNTQNRTGNIAVVELAKEVVFSDDIRPACLPTEDEIDFQKVILTEFTKTSDEKDQVTLLKSKFTHVEQCSLIYQKQSIRIFSDQICGNIARGPDCRSDFGGPLQVPNGKIFTIVAIPSFGPVTCGSSYPDVFTSVKQYLAWIEEAIDE